MAAMTKEQYREAGRKAKEAGDPPAPLMVNKGTWMARAYMEGYGDLIDQVVDPDARREGGRAPKTGCSMPPPKSVGPAIPPRVPARTMMLPARQQGKSITARLARIPNVSDWPRAAREHLMRLLQDEVCERNPVRRQRLNRAIGRMVLRHGKPTARVICTTRFAVDDFIMTTQPHPDGPITVGDLLAGR